MWPFWGTHNVAQKVETVAEAPVIDNTNKIKQWLNCGVVSKHRPRTFIGTNCGIFWHMKFIFECQRCGFEIEKTRKQLSPTERNALIALGYTDLRKDKKNAKTTKSSS